MLIFEQVSVVVAFSIYNVFLFFFNSVFFGGIRRRSFFGRSYVAKGPKLISSFICNFFFPSHDAIILIFLGELTSVIGV